VKQNLGFKVQTASNQPLNVFQGLTPLRSVGANLSGIISNTLLQAVNKGVEVPVLKEMKHQLQTIKEKINSEP
jgi:hypothetical protein